MIALILAGGKGLRLRPLTDDRPKPLVPVAGKPIAEWQLDWLRSNGDLERVVFLCGWKWERLEEHFGSDYHGVGVEYSVEETPLGTGGAFRKAISEKGVSGEDVVMLNGDIITDLRIEEMGKVRGSVAPRPVVTLLLVPYRSRFGIVKVDERSFVTGFEEKPAFPDVWINGGVYLGDADRLLADLPQKGDIERETFPRLASRGQVTAYRYRGFWSLVDSVKDIQEVERELASRPQGLS
ncbi:MAG: nucleotidyltransferase family protein [Nitrososphaerota archaeon]|nr:nucleotidyltransferase family protein [Nitrososphaerota archaeon]MDG6978836.1 nucleotidyltransferase family protein [Nitrososphaerota archaeon]MDG7005822.1 nucleotidyltransferase family protein [Nitrososphaerota archaeon]MDG7021242.1 nucleotidyltransferase family protein [Nitrososphaerota archaeon]